MRYFEALKRNFEALRYVPPRQILRRLQLRAGRRLAPYLPNCDGSGERPAVRQQLPLPLLPPRCLMEPLEGGWLFLQPWGQLKLPVRPLWTPPATDPLTSSWWTNLHYMEFLEGVDDEAFIAFIDDWIECNPSATKDAWQFAWAPYNLSIRVVVWMQQLALRRARLDAAFIARAMLSLTRQLQFLERHLETDIRGNHLIRNIKALLWASAFFDGEAARQWRRIGERLLIEELARQVLDDGCHHERSPSYHCQVFGDLLETTTILEDTRLKGRLAEVLDHMADACVALTHPDGMVALFNDGGLGLAYPPATLLEAHARLGGRLEVPSKGTFALRDAGYFGLRVGDSYLVLDCGPIGPDDLIGHSHADILSFEWTVDGRRIIVDQGTYQYPAGPARQQSRGAKNHNTLVIDAAEPCDFFGAHRCGRRAYPELRYYAPTDAGFVLEGSHDGFRHLPGQPRPVRRIKATGTTLLIRDQIESEREHVGESSLLLHPDCRIETGRGGLVIASGDVTITLSSSSEPHIEDAKWFPDLYVSQPTKRLRFRLAGSPPTHVVELGRQP